MTATVADYQATASAAAAATLAQANTYLTALVNAANVQFSNGFNIDSILPESYNYVDVPTINFPVIAGGLRPNVTALGLPSAPEAPVFTLSVPSTIALPTDDLLAPTSNFTFAEGAYDRTLLDPLRAKLLYDLTNGGYGIDTADEAALFNRARDREVQATLTRIQEAGRTMAARGFPLPPGELSIHVDRAYQEMQDKASDVNRDIFTNSAKRFVENRQFTITESREIERICIAFYNSVQERALNAAKATQELGILVFNALLARYKTRLDAAKINADVQLLTSQIEVARANAYVENFRSQVLAYDAQLRALLEPAKLQVELYRSDIEANRALTDGLIAKNTLQQKVLEAVVQENIQISQMTIENAKAKLLATVEGLKFKTEAAKFGSQEFFAALTAMYGSINSLAVQTATE